MADVTGAILNFFQSYVENISHISSSEAIIFDIAIILVICAIFAFIARMLKQPLIPAYVIAGLIIGPLVLGFVKNLELIYAFSEIGIAFLLFTAGLEISFKKIKEANLKKILIIGTLQILLIFFIGLGSGKLLNLSTMQAAYIGIILSFGSTMVVIKLLSDKGELVTMHGRLVLGILLLQDLAAIIAIVVLMSGGFAIAPIAIAITRLLIILLVAVLLQKFILNRLFRFAARSTELLLLSSLGVLFLFIIITYLSELSIVIGAFIAGVSLANSPFKLELESRITPLRDFFSILFFVALGMQVVFAGVGQTMGIFWFLIACAFIIKPIITIFLLRVNGYRPRTSFLTALSLAQLSEFSLIIGMMGVRAGVISQALFSTIILATIITMAITTYFIEYKGGIYQKFRKPMSAFKFLPTHENLCYTNKKEKSILLIGAHRMGSLLIKDLSKKHKKDLLVFDYNPEIINALIKKKISCIYGDVESPEILENLEVDKLKLVISTVPNHEDNRRLITKIKERNPSLTLILTAQTIDDALDLYENGADYVILPKVVAGKSLAKLIHHKKEALSSLKKEHILRLNKIHNILY